MQPSNDQALTSKKSKLNQILVITGYLFIAFIIFRWFYYINKYSVNLLFSDLIDIYDAHFYGYSLGEYFMFQHGPHRQGLGFIFTKWLDNWSSWNTKVISWSVGIIISGASLIYWKVKQKINPGLSIYDATIFLIILMPKQNALFTEVPNLSHGAMPALLLSLCCLCFFIRNIYLRYSLLIILNFNLIFSAFGLFAAPALLIFSLVESYFKWRRNEKGYRVPLFSSILLLLPWVLFFYNYQFSSANPDFQFPHPYPLEYLQYMTLAYAGLFNVSQMNFIGVIPGAILLLLFLYVLWYQSRILLSPKADINSVQAISAKIIILLISFSLLFIIMTAIGRVSLGLGGSKTSRYVIYLVPALLAVYFHAVSSAKNKKSWLLLALLLMVLATTFNYPTIKGMKKIQYQKTVWKDTYLQTENIEEADNSSGLTLHPSPEDARLKAKLQYLKKHKLNLYLDKR